MKNLAVRLIKLYRNYMSPMKIQCCRFYPSCSQYSLDAIDKYGLFRGLFKGIKRLLRCHPFSKGGYDPA